MNEVIRGSKSEREIAEHRLGEDGSQKTYTQAQMDNALRKQREVILNRYKKVMGFYIETLSDEGFDEFVSILSKLGKGFEEAILNARIGEEDE